MVYLIFCFTDVFDIFYLHMSCIVCLSEIARMEYSQWFIYLYASTRCSVSELFHVLLFSSNIRCFRIDPPPTFSSNEASGGPAVWSHGYTEASGVKNKWVQFVNDGEKKQTAAIPLVKWSLTNPNPLRVSIVKVRWLRRKYWTLLIENKNRV